MSIVPVLLRRRFYGSAADVYAVLGYKPELVFDFDDEYYRANSTATTFADALTHSASSNATMVDSDGLLKWRPHNLFTNSGDMDGTGWTGFRTTYSDGDTAPDGSQLFLLGTASETNSNGSCAAQQGMTLAAGTYTMSVFAKAGPSDPGLLVLRPSDNADFTDAVQAWFDLETGTVTSISSSGSSLITAPLTDIQDFGGGVYLCSLTFTVTGSVSCAARHYISDASGALAVTAGKQVQIWGAHAYRSDLGGMVNNPDRGDSYVPTTSTARYLPRRGHHVYNGTSWVNEGLLHESEQRVNLLHTTDALVTQSLTVTAVPHTLHFTGTGTVTLLGASTAGPLVGTGTGEQNRVSLTFTPIAASLTLTVTGTVTNAQLEVGSTPSSYIPNLAASGSATRAAETLTIPSAKLPWPTPNVIGSELVTNGTFDTDSDWTKGTGWTISGGKATSAGGLGKSLYQTGVFPAAGVYKIAFTVTDYTSNALYVGHEESQIVFGPYTSAGTYTVYMVTSATQTDLYFYSTAGGFSGSIDNISVREIDPLAVSIQMQGRMTYADDGVAITTDGASGTALFYSWRANSTNYISAVLDTEGANVGDIWFMQEIGGVADWARDTSDPYSPGINVPFNIASRHGSTFINGAVDGTALPADLTPTALPDLSATDLNLGYDYMGTIKLFRIWADDLGDSGIAEASEGEPSSYLLWDATADTYVQRIYG